MGGFLTTCKQRRSLHVTDNNSNIEDDRTLPRFIPHTSFTPLRIPRVRIQDERKSETLSSTYASIPHERLRDLKKRRDDLFVKDEPSQGYSSNYPQPGNKKEPLPDYDYDDEQGNDNFFEHQTIIRDRGLRTVSSRITLHSENKNETYNIESDSYYDCSYIWSEKASAKKPDSKKRGDRQFFVEVHEPTQLPHQKIIMADSSNSEKGMKEKEFQVIKDTKFLPRYTYHRSLLDWFMEDIPQDPMFQACPFTDCTILIGGNIKDETISKICGENTLREKLTVTDLRKAVRHTQSLIVYFLRSNVTYEYREIEQIVKQLSFEGTFLFVMTSEMFDNEPIKSTLKETVLELGNLNVEIVIENRSDILFRMTRVLEQRLDVYLEQTKMKLRDYSRHHNVRSSLCEVNAILRRLKQAACYPEPYTDEEEEEHSQENEMDKKLHSFEDKIIYQRYDGDTLYVITTDQDVKDRLDTWYSTSGIKNIKLVITVDNTLPISELATPIESLHGAKMVYVNENVDAFKRDLNFSTTGSLMMANGDPMVIVTSKHALKEKKHVYTLIDKAVVRLGQGIEQPLDEMQRLNEDIAVVEIDEETRSVITDKCEKMLLGGKQSPTPAKISLRKLKKDDIVHKRGANTKLTTGTVESVENKCVGRFREPSCVISIIGKQNQPFADKGDSGSLVFQPSLSVEDPYLDVLAMVQGKVDIPSPTCNPDIICFPFHEGCDVLIKHIKHLNVLQFYNV